LSTVDFHILFSEGFGFKSYTFLWFRGLFIRLSIQILQANSKLFHLSTFPINFRSFSCHSSLSGLRRRQHHWTNNK